MSSLLLAGQGAQWRVALPIGNAGMQLRLAIQAEAASVLRAATRLRWLAAGLLLLGAVLVGAGLELF